MAPRVSVEVAHGAVPEETATLVHPAMALAPFVKVTVPDAPDGVIVAVIVACCPKTVTLGPTESAVVVATGAGVTVTEVVCSELP